MVAFTVNLVKEPRKKAKRECFDVAYMKDDGPSPIRERKCRCFVCYVDHAGAARPVAI